MPEGHVPETPGQAAVVADLHSEHLLNERDENARETFARLAGYFEEGES